MMNPSSAVPEIWCVIPNCPEYEASSHGRIRRLRAGRGAQSGRVLRPWLSAGYLYVHLWRSNQRVGIAVHRLVAMTFLPPPKPGQTQVAHADGVRTNDAASNLRWASPTENAGDRLIHGTHFLGEKNPRARLTANQVLNIRASVAGGYSHSAIAAAFGICRQTVGDIASKRRWGHL